MFVCSRAYFKAQFLQRHTTTYKDYVTDTGVRQNLNMFNLNIKIYKNLRIHGYNIDKE
jgi:hypothetical protein